MKVGEALSLAQKAQLRTEMEVFLAQLLGVERLELLAQSEQEIPVEFLSELHHAWLKIQEGYPVAYLVQNKEFYGLSFYVDERVLIPRPETEALVPLVLSHLSRKGLRVLELGTGSGALACAIKHTRPDLELWATDVDPKALQVANKNCVQLNLDVKLLEADLLGSPFLQRLPRDYFDVLVMNLPYIGSEEHAFLEEKVRKFEPHRALDGGLDGLRLYARLWDQIQREDWRFPIILGEIGFSQGEAIRSLCHTTLPSYRFSLFQDDQGLDRHFLLEKA